MGNAVNTRSPFALPQQIRPVEGKQPATIEGSGSSQAELGRQWDQRKSAPVGLGSTETGASFAQAIDNRATQAIDGARGVEGKLQTSLNDPNFQKVFDETLKNRGMELSPKQLQQVTQEIAQKMEAKEGQQLPVNALKDVQHAKQNLESAQKLLAASQASYPEHAGAQGQMRDNLANADTHGMMIDMGIRMAEAAEAEVGRYAQKIGERLDTIQKLNELDSLMEKYRKQESADLTKPEKGQERDFARLETLRRELVEERGVPLTWAEGKWASKGEFEGLKKGIDLSRQALFSENQTAQIYLQKVSTSSQQYFLLVTTFITKHGELLKEAIRNMQR